MSQHQDHQPHQCPTCRRQGRPGAMPCPAHQYGSQDHTKSASTQPYRTTRAAQEVARRLTAADPEGFPLIEITFTDGARIFTAPYRCYTCKTPHASQLEADLCCPANELTEQQMYEAAAQSFARAYDLITRITNPDSPKE